MTHTLEITIPENGILTLPEEFRGKKFKMVPLEEEPSPDDEQLSQILEANHDFWHPKTIEQLVAEQGIKPIRSIEDMRPKEPIWESDEDFYEFLVAMGRDVDNYLSIYRNE